MLTWRATIAQDSLLKVNLSSTLKEAIEHHSENNKNEAIKLYKQFLNAGGKDKRAFTNFAALLRGNGEAQAALEVVKDGLNQFPNSPILLNTLGNCLRDLGRGCEAIAAYRMSIKYHKGYFDPQISIVGALYDMGLKKLSDKCLMELFKYYGVEKTAILNQIITREVENATNENRQINQNLDIIIEHANKTNDKLKDGIANNWFLLSQLCCSTNKLDEAEKYYHKGVLMTKEKIQSTNKDNIKKKAKEIYAIASWNMSCQLLKVGRLEKGWQLFDHGLNTPAEGAQKWQRALFKPFTYKKVKPWKGENLSNKTILLLGEQGIGDTMAFMTLINRVVDEASKVHIILPERLCEIYKRSFKNCSIHSDKEIRDQPLNHNSIDYQCALGSIPQYRCKDLKSFKSRKFRILANQERVNLFKKRYKQHKNQIIIGISWQGGGRKDRLKDKSIDLGHLLNALKPYDIRILSLQYGDDHKIVKDAASKFGVNFIDDDSVQATKDMSNWLDQVEACDGVVSIANTTIHGAGSLHKPTLCLLGSKADWRWLNDKNEKFSYWYPTVEIAWQDVEKQDWKPALAKIDNWMRQTIGVG